MSLIPIFSPYQTPISISLTATDFLSDEISDPEIAFTDLSIGAANAARRVFIGVAIYMSNSAVVSAATIGGVSATIHATNGNDSNRLFSCIISAVVPTGTTADVFLTIPDPDFDSVFCAVAVYRVLNLVNATAFDIDSDDSTEVDTTMSIDVPGGGFVIAVCSSDNETEGPFFTTSGVSENYDDNGFAIGMSSGLSSQTGRAITFSPGNNEGTLFAGVCASFR